MSSVPMTNGGDFPTISTIGCTESSTVSGKQIIASDQNSPHESPAPQHYSSIRSDSRNSPVSHQPAHGAQEPSCPPSIESDSAATDNDLTPDNDLTSDKTPETQAGSIRDHSNAVPDSCLPLHRIAEVRAQQGISVRSMARRMGIDIKSYRKLEEQNRDLKLSELGAIQRALEVPLADLLQDRNGLSRPVEERAKMVKAMKTAVALRESKASARVNRLAQMLCEQLVDLMPELEEVGGWPQYGARRGANALGRALAQQIDMSNLGQSD